MPAWVTESLLCLGVLAFIASLVVNRPPKSPRLLPLFRARGVLGIVALGGVYLLLRPGAGVDGRAALQATLVSKQPLVMEFFSNT